MSTASAFTPTSLADSSLTAAIFSIATQQDADEAVAAAMRRLVRQEPGWLRCFLWHASGSADGCVQLVRSNLSWSAAGVGPCPDAEAAHRLRFGVARLAARRDGAGRPVIVLGFDALRRMLDAGHTLDEVASAHVWWLKEQLLREEGGTSHGVSLVQDLAGMTAADVSSFVMPSALLTQLNYARLLTAAFPCEYGALVILDAPAAFGMLWSVVRPVLPAALAERVSFCVRDGAEEGGGAVAAGPDATLDVKAVAAAIEAAPRPSAAGAGRGGAVSDAAGPGAWSSWW